MSGLEVIVGVVLGSVGLTLGGRYAIARTTYKCAKYLVKKSLKSSLKNEDWEGLKKAMKKLEMFEKKYSVEKLSKYVEKYAIPIAEKLGMDMSEVKDKMEDVLDGIDWIKERIEIINKEEENKKFIDGFKLIIDNAFVALDDGKITMEEVQAIFQMKRLEKNEKKVEEKVELKKSSKKTLTVIREEEIILEAKPVVEMNPKLERQRKREQERLRRQALKHKASRPQRPEQ